MCVTHGRPSILRCSLDDTDNVFIPTVDGIDRSTEIGEIISVTNPARL